jgi:hypothetical protein
MWRGPVKWSPCELDYLKVHRHDRSINEISLWLAKSRNAIKNKLDELDGKKLPIKKNRKSRIGKREDIVKNGKAQYFRSSWEANVARWMDKKKTPWEYEPTVFPFYEFGIKTGTTSYCPDFKYGKTGLWLEVKGQLDGKGRTAIRRFKKYYPAEFKKLRAVVGRPNTVADKFFKKLGVPVIGYMNEMTKKYKDSIENWE